MKSGICYPSIGRSITWTSVSEADFPSQNLALIDEPRRVARANVQYFAGAFDGPQTVDFVALIGHNAPAGAKIRVVIYAGAPLSPPPYVYDTGNIPFYPAGAPVSGYQLTRPVLLPAPVTGGGIYVGVSEMGAGTLEAGAIDVGRFWEWPELNRAREIGFSPRSITEKMGGGAAHVMKQWAPRTVAGTREAVSQAELDTKVLDFEGDTGLSRAFVWCEGIDTPASWDRQCFLATNQSLGGSVVSDYGVGQHDFSLVEHLK